jgi:hypothetical protein
VAAVDRSAVTDSAEFGFEFYLSISDHVVVVDILWATLCFLFINLCIQRTRVSKFRIRRTGTQEHAGIFTVRPQSRVSRLFR